MSINASKASGSSRVTACEESLSCSAAGKAFHTSAPAPGTSIVVTVFMLRKHKIMNV